MGEVLAYGTEGALDTLSVNPCVRLLLDGYRQTFEVLREAAVPAQKVCCAAQYTKTVSPLLKSKWGQSYPFNAMTGYPYSGCVATAVAQVTAAAWIHSLAEEPQYAADVAIKKKSVFLTINY